MPASVMHRAENVLNNISNTLRTVQSEMYALQDRIAEQIHQAYLNQNKVSLRKPVMELLSLATYCVAAYDPAGLTTHLTKTLNLMGQDKKGNSIPLKEKTLDLVSRFTGSVSSMLVEPSQVSTQENLQKLQSNQGEISTLHQSLQTMIQTHDTALQRLQNMEGANRQS
ncbi:MAG: hypothetical protein ACRDFB_02010 [Rhabdochlamydiaceae bacterium]